MSPSCFQALSSALQHPHLIPSPKRASVVIVLRHSASAFPSPNSSPQLLLIQRAPNPRDPYSAHIAFPGGCRDPTDQSDLHTAIREAQEEVAIQLNDESSYKLLGRLNDRRITKSGRKLNAVLSAFVFEQLPNATPPPMQLQTSEVASAFWVPLNQLHKHSSEVCEHHVPMPFLRGDTVVVNALNSLWNGLGMNTLRMPAVHVLRNGQDFITTPEVDAPPMPLWGLTLACVGDVVTELGLRRVDWPSYLPGNRFLASFVNLFCEQFWSLTLTLSHITGNAKQVAIEL